MPATSRNRSGRRFLHQRLFESLETRNLLAGDLFDPNETIDTAAELYTGDHVISGLTIDEVDDSDFFSWRATADGQLDVDVLFSHAEGDLDLRIFNSQEHFLGESNSLDDNESMSIQVTNGETYKIWVFGYEQSANEYTLRIDGPGEVPRDAYEWNDQLVTATDLGAADQTLRDLTIHGEGQADHSHDYFKWTAVETGSATVSIDFRHIFGDLKLEVFDNAGDPIGNSDTNTDGESVTFATVRNQATYFKVSGFNYETNPNYSLTINGPDLPADRFEPNDSQGFGTAISNGSYPDLSVHRPGNEDWYTYTAAVDGTLNVDLTFSDADGDIELEIYSGQIRVATSTSATDNESISLPVTAGSTFSIRVFAHPFVTNTGYTLTVDGPTFQIPFTVDVIDIQPNLVAQPVDEVIVTFNREVSNLNLSQHLSLVRTNDNVQQVSLASATLQSLGNNRWKVGNLAPLTKESGFYDLTVGSLQSSIEDANGNALQNSDVTRWTQGAGDANLDGKFDSSDLIQVFRANQFEDAIVGNSKWSTGDWDGDGEFGTSDLLVAFQTGWYSSGAPATPRPQDFKTIAIEPSKTDKVPRSRLIDRVLALEIESLVDEDDLRTRFV